MDRAIGVIDSGVGGLTVAYELMRQLPNERLIYLGDTLRCPYGPRPEIEIRTFTWEMVHFLMTKNIKMLVIACNTATAFTLQELQKQLPIPVIGVIQPGARAAIKVTESDHVGVIGTQGTIGSDAYAKALKTIKPDIKVDSLACPLFVPMVEKGILDGVQCQSIVQDSLRPLQKITGMDTLILGCTHYPIIKDVISRVMGPSVQLISSSEETAREASIILDMNGILNKTGHRGYHEFYTTGNLDTFKKITNRIFAESMDTIQSVTMERAVI
ncbi:glutamate racemase [Virgibacillus sp. 179-BFC.A HS]|uniref:Glutamate racemase n=1 Tax=Tigheibacillus jepli TaxID=3035914 RepID=A0ABU5CGI0_9BACI|nr:glutamate racemase [Virgibacillus sp. 179-BFC.A HS]MDY0405423.1 glutamate racemase [Virgibacillus sp. 179-BFC.A HS]